MGLVTIALLLASSQTIHPFICSAFMTVYYALMYFVPFHQDDEEIVKGSDRTSGSNEFNCETKKNNAIASGKTSKIDLTRFAGRFLLTEQRNVGALMASQGMGRLKRRIAEAADVTQDIHLDEDLRNITFVIRATVRGMGNGERVVTYELNSADSQKMTNPQTGISFLDRIRTDTIENDVVLFMERVEVNNKFRMDIIMRITEEDRLVTESVMTLLHSGEKIKASRVFRRVEGAKMPSSPFKKSTSTKSSHVPTTNKDRSTNDGDDDDDTDVTVRCSSSDGERGIVKKRSWTRSLFRGKRIWRAVAFPKSYKRTKLSKVKRSTKSTKHQKWRRRPRETMTDDR